MTDRLVAVRLDHSFIGGGPATVVAFPASVAEYRKAFSDKDGALDPHMRLWREATPCGIGDRVVSTLICGTGRGRLTVQPPRGAHVTMRWEGRDLLGEVTGCVDGPGIPRLTVRYFNGEPWPIEPDMGDCTALERTYESGEA